MLLILLEISKADLNDAAFQRIIGVLETGGAVDKGLADISGGKRLGGLEIGNVNLVRYIYFFFQLTNTNNTSSLIFSNSESQSCNTRACGFVQTRHD